MVAIDGDHNGWRRLVLPIAHIDRLVLNAVLSVASFHLTSRQYSRKQRLLSGDKCSLMTATFTSDSKSSWSTNLQAIHLYNCVITELQRRDLRGSDNSKRLFILLAILTLLVAVMVTGSDDFPALFRLLESALRIIGGEESLGKDELATFIMRQVRKMRVYAAPLLSKESGVTTLSSKTQITRALDCVRHCSKEHPEHSVAVSAVMDLIQQSYDIYLFQASHDIHQPSMKAFSTADTESICRVQRFKETLELFPSGSPGKQVLIWATFVAASDCILEEHKTFFTNTFVNFYKRSGFENILRGLEHLKMAWARRASGDSWISLLPEAKVLVM
ncbi:uncharacterized protein CTRU02_215343 [Colletotrichum truncatum]|uniref:Uncharacterized protein n=1 Tax=Colletotrichum truncatum TaxID=5467 RepID=A0ACC3YCZ8_COLTU